MSKKATVRLTLDLRDGTTNLLDIATWFMDCYDKSEDATGVTLTCTPDLLLVVELNFND